MPPPDTTPRVNIISPEGEVRSVPEGKVLGDFLVRGWTIEQPAQNVERAVTESRRSTVAGLGGTVKAGGRGFLGALTFGATTGLEAAIGGEAARESIKLGRAEHGAATTVGEIAGAITQAAVLPGSGAVTSARGIARAAGRDALIGAAQGAGNYLADTAIEDRDITAEGLLGASATAGLIGGAATGTLGAASKGLARTKALFPEATVTREAADALEGEAGRAVASTLNHTDDLVRQADAYVADVKQARRVDPLVLEEQARIRSVKAAQDAARVAKLEAQALEAQRKAELAGVRVEKAKAPRAVRAARGRGVPDTIADGPPTTPDGGTADTVAAKITASYPDAPGRPAPDYPLDPNRPAEVLWRRGDAPLEPSDVSREISGWRDRNPDRIVPEAPDLPPTEGTAVGRKRPVTVTSEPLGIGDVPKVEGTPPAGTVVGRRPAPGRVPDDLEAALAATSKRLEGGESIGALNAEGQGAVDVPEGFDLMAKVDGRALYASPPIVRSGVPSVADVKRMGQQTAYVVRPSDLLKHDIRGNVVVPDARRARAGSVRQAWDEGKGLAPVEIQVDAKGRMYVEDGNHRLIAAAEAGDRPVVVKFRHVSDAGAGDDIKPLLSAAGRPVDDFHDAVLAVDPQARKIADLADELKQARAEAAAVLTSTPGEYVASLSRRADDLASARGIARDRDVLYTAEDLGDVLGAKIGTPGQSLDRPGRAVRSRLRNPYTDDELIAKAANNPTFVEAGGARTTARADLAERITSGAADPRTMQVEDLVPRVDPETGEILPGLARAMRPASSDDIMGAIERNRRNPEFPKSYVSDDIMHALRGRLDFPDMERTATALARVEKASHDLTVALGPRASAESQAHAAAYAERLAQHTETLGLAEAQRAAAISDAAMPEVARVAAESKATEIAAARAGGVTLEAVAGDAAAGRRGALSSIADIGAALEVMSTIGIPGLPDPKRIPVIGPVLGVYLKARAGVALWKKLGGKLPASVETTAAKRATETRNRMNAAIRSMIASGERATARAASVVTPTAVVLGRSLFSEAKTKPRDETVGEAWLRHRNEIAAAKRPGALERVLRERVPTSDPRLAAALVSTARRRLDYLDQKMPRPPPDGGIPSDGPPWQPSPEQTEAWARIVEATDDPAGVLERAVNGDVSIDQIDAVRTVYPRLYLEAQMALIEAAVSAPSIPYARRIQLGLMFAVPLTPTQDPDFAAAIQATYTSQGTPPPPPPPTPRPSANPDFSGGALLQEQKP